MHSIRYTVRAEIDLEEMIDYIARESFANAIKYLERYEARLDLLMRNPQIGTPDAKTKTFAATAEC